MYEYSDLVLVHLANKIKINLHFRFHHYTTLSLSYTFIHDIDTKGIPFHGLIFVFNNVLMHTMVYLYHSNVIRLVKESNIFYYMLRIQGYIQLLSGFIFCYLSNFIYGDLEWIHLWALFCYTLYFILYQIQIYESWIANQLKVEKEH